MTDTPEPVVITAADVQHLAGLARIALTPEEIEHLAGELTVIVDSVAKVRDIFVKLKKPDDWSNWHIRALLQTLEQRFPGK